MKRIAAAVAALGIGTAASASSITFTDSVGLRQTDFALTLTVDQFDPSLGQLNSIDIALNAESQHSLGFESRDQLPSSFSFRLASELTATSGSALNLFAVAEAAEETFSATAFDGIIDFAGTSGATFSDRSGSGSAMQTLTDPADFAGFIGAGFVDIFLTGEDVSRVSTNALDFALTSSSQASGSIAVTYNFDESSVVIPVPAALPLLALGLGALGLVGRRRG